MSPLKMKSISEVAKAHPEEYKKFKAMKGICKVCGCTENNACYHPDFGPCWWMNGDQDLCSHCVELKDDPKVERERPRMREQHLRKSAKS